MFVLGVIPARGGSKGIPRKNLRPLCGKPLIQHTIEAALEARGLWRTVVSTEDQEIAEISSGAGIEPIIRPTRLARDETPMLPVVQHAVLCVEEQSQRIDAVCLLQPTSPIRAPHLIDACIELLERSGADAVVTVLPVPASHNPHWVYFRGDDGYLRLSSGETTPIPRRQDLPPAWHREGSVYVTRRDVIIDRHDLYGGHLLGYPVDSDASVVIDDPEDWEKAERLLVDG